MAVITPGRSTPLPRESWWRPTATRCRRTRDRIPCADTAGDAPVLTGSVKANDSVVARIALFDLALASAPQARQLRRYGTLQVDDVAVTLSAEAASALNDVFGVTAFAAGLPIGTARVNTYFYEPSP